MIEARHIIKRYGDLEVLRGVDVTIGEAEVVTIVGPSGAGKTTLLQIIGTLDRPDGGQVTYDGVDVLGLKGKDLAQFRNRNIGFVFQFHQLLPEFTMLENVAIPALIGGAKREVAYDRARKLLEYLKLADRLDHKPSQLSGGERQRVAVARALVNQPKVILADAQPVTYNTVTDAQGNYSVDVTLVEGATYQATFAKDGYVEQTVAIEDLDTPLNIVMEAETTVGISDINAARVASVRYVNAMGQISDKPFKGVNIVVTTLVDGTQTTTKVIK